MGLCYLHVISVFLKGQWLWKTKQRNKIVFQFHSFSNFLAILEMDYMTSQINLVNDYWKSMICVYMYLSKCRFSCKDYKGIFVRYLFLILNIFILKTFNIFITHIIWQRLAKLLIHNILGFIYLFRLLIF